VTPASRYADRDAPRGLRREPETFVELLEDLDETGPLDNALDGDDPRGQQPHPLGVEPADRVFGQDGQTFLGFLVTREPHREQLQRLRVPVRVGDDMRAHLVVDQCIHPAGAEVRGCRDQ
jgi:hypothetical protein